MRYFIHPVVESKILLGVGELFVGLLVSFAA
jgi:hypothetical protein